MLNKKSPVWKKDMLLPYAGLPGAELVSKVPIVFASATWQSLFKDPWLSVPRSPGVWLF
jgi:hypothetical protein